MAGNTMSAPEARSSTHRSQRKTALSLVVKAGPLLVAAGLALMSETVAGEATLAVGGNHACIISTTGGVKCWGLNSKGQLGYEDTDKRGASSETMGEALEYVDLGTDRTAVSITAGQSHTCAVLDDASLKCWGYGNYGQLGQGDTYSHGNAIYTMGDYLEPVNLGNSTTGEPRKAVKASAGIDHTCVLTEENEVICFGHNDVGQLGVENIKDVGKLAEQMGDALVPVDFGSGSGYAVDISSGPCALLSDDTVKCWGFNLYGATGIPGEVDVGIAEGDMGESLPPVSLGSDGSGTELKVSSVASGNRHNCVIVDDGMVKCWGKNTKGNLGLGDVHDRGIDEDELGDFLPYTDLGMAAYRLDGGTDHTCAILIDFSVKCWGNNYLGALGLEDFRTRGDYPGEMGNNLPAVNLGEGAVEISAGGDFACAILDSGGVKCWGEGNAGKLGQGNSQDLGDEISEIEELPTINLGSGVYAAAPIMPTLAPTPAPTRSPTAAPTPAPSKAPTPAPTAAATPAPTPGLTPAPTPVPAAATPSPTQASGMPSLQSNSGGVTSVPATAAPVAPTIISGDSSGNSLSDLPRWQLVTAAVLIPLAAVALIAGAVTIHKRRKASQSAA